MTHWRTPIFLLTLGGVVLAGCEDEAIEPPVPNEVPTPSVQSDPVEEPATRPAIVQNISPELLANRRLGGSAVDPIDDATLDSAMHVGNAPVMFAPAVLHLIPEDGGTKAILFSDDPDDAMNADWDGNAFYFQMFFEGMTVDEVLGQSGLAGGIEDGPVVAEWVFQHEGSERRDTRNGLFLAGGDRTLQPEAGEIIIDAEGARLSVRVAGFFRQFEGDRDNVGRQVPVRAVLYPEVLER
jgi:hypothetical protein